MKNFILFLSLSIFCCQTILFAAEKEPKLYFDTITFDKVYKDIQLTNGIKIFFIHPILGSDDTTLIGVRLHIQNLSDEKIILIWRDSLISCEKISTIPFIQGVHEMRREDMKNRVAIPDILIWPKNIVVQDVYFSNREYIFLVDKYRILGLDLYEEDPDIIRELIDPIKLTLKFRNERGVESFHEVESLRMRSNY
ncbi:MAG: hypothetical protein LBO03_05175 [Acidaminococcales bacterium]|jgi:hypothetical protein|nr:hypothetical protein [Acidaminococcales bacterium]